MARRVRLDHADDVTAIGKIYPQDKHGRGHPHHSADPSASPGSLGGKPTRRSDMELLKPGKDRTPEIEALYRYGRHYPNAKPHDRPHQSEPREVMHNPMKAKDQQANQFEDGKVADHVDVGKAWTRGYGEPHPHFDAGPSGFRHDTKVRR